MKQNNSIGFKHYAMRHRKELPHRYAQEKMWIEAQKQVIEYFEENLQRIVNGVTDCACDAKIVMMLEHTKKRFGIDSNKS